MQRSQSIEDLIKKQSGQSSGDDGAVAPVKKAAPAQKKTDDQKSSAEKLTEKMEEIKLSDLEKKAKKAAETIGLPYINLDGFPIAPEALSLIPKEQAEKERLICFLHIGDELKFATTNPTDAVNELAKTISKEQFATSQLYFVSEKSFRLAQKLYDALPEIREVSYGYRIEEKDLERYERELSDFKELRTKIAEVSTTDVVTLMVGGALKSEASDIHVEAEEEQIKIRYRIDGMLQDIATLPHEEWQQIISRLKLLAGVKINITEIPQDGRITIYLTDEKLDIRVSFLPTSYGESVVMRILRPKFLALEFTNLGLRGKALHDLSEQITKPNGMIITTGPTGSGKTTTLYAMLEKLNKPEVKIITLEDPIEYKLKGINQSQIQHDKGYTFAMGLRSILRQDPDIVMVGEIRDLETAEISIQAALTGHLVISTIHTNSAAAAIPRFISMGVKPFLLAPSLNCLIGQRLVRKLCPDCKQVATLSSSVLKQIQEELKLIPTTSGQKIPDLGQLAFYSPGKVPNCPTCHGLGYKGRIGIYEVFTMNKEIEEAILSEQVSLGHIEDLARKHGMVTMVQDGLLKAADGLTSVEEVLRVAAIEAEAEDVTTAT
jgi:type IV pilus assembly protein PilB